MALSPKVRRNLPTRKVTRAPGCFALIALNCFINGESFIFRLLTSLIEWGLAFISGKKIQGGTSGLKINVMQKGVTNGWKNLSMEGAWKTLRRNNIKEVKSPIVYSFWNKCEGLICRVLRFRNWLMPFESKNYLCELLVGTPQKKNPNFLFKFFGEGDIQKTALWSYWISGVGIFNHTTSLP